MKELKSRAQLNPTNDKGLEYLWDIRGVGDYPCQVCGGTGVRTYSNTSTWHGGIGGQAMTTDVCNKCWGTGDVHRPGVDLKRSNDIAKAAKKLAEVAKLALDSSWNGPLDADNPVRGKVAKAIEAYNLLTKI